MGDDSNDLIVVFNLDGELLRTLRSDVGGGWLSPIATLWLGDLLVMGEKRMYRHIRDDQHSDDTQGRRLLMLTPAGKLLLRYSPAEWQMADDERGDDQREMFEYTSVIRMGQRLVVLRCVDSEDEDAPLAFVSLQSITGLCK